MDGLKHLKGVVTHRREVSGDLWIVRIHPEASIAFVPGQYVTIGLPVEDKLIERPYSVASAPHEPELEFFLEVVPGGKLSPQLYDVPVGGEVHLRPAAKGRFTFDDRSGFRNHFMAATVTGIAPFVSMIRSLGQADSVPYQVLILHAASLSTELGYMEELQARACRHKWLRYVPTVSRIRLDPTWQGERGRVEDVARKYLDDAGFDPSSTTAYVCGNPNMILQMQGVLDRAGFEPGCVRRELYWPA